MKDEALGYFEPRPCIATTRSAEDMAEDAGGREFVGTDAAGRDDGIGTCKLRPHPEEAAISAFTRLRRAMAAVSKDGRRLRVPPSSFETRSFGSLSDEVFETRGYADAPQHEVFGDAILRIAPQDEGSEREHAVEARKTKQSKRGGRHDENGMEAILAIGRADRARGVGFLRWRFRPHSRRTPLESASACR